MEGAQALDRGEQFEMSKQFHKRDNCYDGTHNYVFKEGNILIIYEVDCVNQR